MNTRIGIQASLLLASLVIASTAQSATIRVERWGEDTPECGAKSAPCETINHAVIFRSKPNGKVIVGPGRYDSPVTINQNVFGQDLTGLKLESANGMHTTVIRTTVINTHAIAVHQSRVRIGKRGKGFTAGGATSANYSAIATVDNPEKVRIEGNRAILSHSGIFVTGDKIQVRHNIAEFNNQAGFRCDGCDGSVFRDNRSRNNGGTGYEYYNSLGLAIVGNSAAHNGDAGQYLDFDAAGTRLTDNVSEFNTDNGFTYIDGNGSLSRGNIALLNSAYGFDMDQVTNSAPPDFRHNLSVFNVDDGFFLDDLIDARVENNAAVSNQQDGFTLTPSTAIAVFKRNNSYASGSGCGIANNSGTNLRPEKHFYGGPEGFDDVLDGDNHDGVCGGSLVGDGFSPKPNPVKTRKAEKL